VIHASGTSDPRELLGPANWPADGGSVSRVDWSEDGRTIYFNSFEDSEAVSYWPLPATGGTPQLLAHFDHEPICQEFALRDNRLYFTVDDRSSDIKVMEVNRTSRP
jgi:hypothetical protein